MFYGEYASTLDDKGRVIVPAKLRDVVPEAEEGSGFMMRLGEDGCVMLCTPRRWRELECEINRAPQGARSARRRRRFIFSQTQTGQCDRQGRLRIPQELLDGAGVTRQVMVVGVSDQIEVWDRARWEAFKSEMMSERESDAEAYPL